MVLFISKEELVQYLDKLSPEDGYGTRYGSSLFEDGVRKSDQLASAGPVLLKEVVANKYHACDIIGMCKKDAKNLEHRRGSGAEAGTSGRQEGLEAKLESLDLNLKLLASKVTGPNSSVTYNQHYHKHGANAAVMSLEALYRRVTKENMRPLTGATKAVLAQFPREVNGEKPFQQDFINALKDQKSACSLVDSHWNPYLGGHAPDGTLVAPGCPLDPFNAVLAFELQSGALDNIHRGKAIHYCELMLEANPSRPYAMCITLNETTLEAYLMEKSVDGHTSLIRSNNVKLDGLGLQFILNVMRQKATALGWDTPTLKVAGQDLQATALLGAGRGVHVYRVSIEGEMMACKVHSKGRAASFQMELAALLEIKEHPHAGLPLLHAHTESDGHAELLLLVTSPVVTLLRPETLSQAQLKDLFDILAHLHIVIKVVHFDVEPKHMCITPGEQVLLLDLSTARPLPGASNHLVARAGPMDQYAGTLLYASSEILKALQAPGEKPLCAPHPRHDMEALAKSIYAMIHKGAADSLAALNLGVDVHLKSQQPELAAKAVQEFWEGELGSDTLAGEDWRAIMNAAQQVPAGSDPDAYMEATGALFKMLARKLRACV